MKQNKQARLDALRAKQNEASGKAPSPKKQKQRKALLLFAVLILTVIAYYLLNGIFPYAFLAFFGLAILLGFGYVIANRGFVRNGVDYATLPDSMTPEEKLAYLDGRDSRRKKTEWMLYLLIPLLVTIALDFLFLFIFEPWLKGIGIL